MMVGMAEPTPEQKAWRAELAAQRALPWPPYDPRPSHRCLFVGGPHDQDVRYLPSMPAPEPALPPLWVEVSFNDVYGGFYAREGSTSDPSRWAETWRYAWMPEAPS
jgi:hypothetical protein